MAKFDALLKKATYFERMALYSDRKSFLQALAQETDEEIVLPQDLVTGYPPIPQDVQEMLSRIVTVEGVGLPLKIDGKLGPKTRQAIDAFKAKFGIPHKFTDESVFNSIKSTYNRNLDKYGK